jgi:hypothetical protein
MSGKEHVKCGNPSIVKEYLAESKEGVMGGFDVYFAPCEAVGEMVIIDQTKMECMCEHECPPGRVCPLEGCFSEVSGLFETAPPLCGPLMTKH